MRIANEFQVLFIILFIIGFIADIFFIPIMFDLGSDIRLFLLLLLWIVLSRFSNFSSKATFKMALAFLAVLFAIFLLSKVNPTPTPPNQTPPIDRVASWIYFFLFIGIIQQFFESRKKE